MKINADITKVMKLRKAGATGKQQLFMERKAIEFVPNLKYLGIVLQPALGFGDHVEQLVTRTATTIACLGNLQKIPLTLAMKMFDPKIMPMIRCGMTAISRRLAKTNMRNLDRCKSMYLKAVFGLRKHTSNTLVLDLANEKTICQTLRSMNYEFGDWEEYAEDRSRGHIAGSPCELNRLNLNYGERFQFQFDTHLFV